jgi:predicted aspartyl protease
MISCYPCHPSLRSGRTKVTTRIASTAMFAGWLFCILVQPSYSQLALYAQIQAPNLPLGETVWEGSYLCVQGPTNLRLKARAFPDRTIEAIFEFGPIHGNNNIPTGSFLLRGINHNSGGLLQLTPVRWISQPVGYSMVGLSGVVSELTYSGAIIGGQSCGSFSVSRRLSDAASKATPPLRNTPPSSTSTTAGTRRTVIPLQVESGTFTVPVSINGKITLNFVIDSGASDVSIPADVVLTLIRTGTINAADFLGQKVYRLADGSTMPSHTFRIRSLKVGDRIIENVTGSIAPSAGALLLGQSFLSRFQLWSVDNQRRSLILE